MQPKTLAPLFVRPQPGGRPETKADPTELESREKAKESFLSAVCRSLATSSAMAYWRSGGGNPLVETSRNYVQAKMFGNNVLAGIRGSYLDMESVQFPMGMLVDKEFWSALDAYVISLGEPGISSVSLPREREPLASVCEAVVDALTVLTQLKLLEIQNCWAGEMDLTALKHLEVVRLRNVSEPVVLSVPDKVHVYGSCNGATSGKSKVLYFDDGKQVGPPRPLAGVTYDRTAKDFDDDKQLQLDARLADYQLNGVAVHKDAKSDPPLIEPRIVCRDLVMQWNIDREKHLKAGLSGPGGHDDKKMSLPERRLADSEPGEEGATDFFSYREYLSKDRISAHVRNDLTSRLMALVHNGFEYAFEVERFGDLLADALTAMAPGEHKRYFLGSYNHAIAVELRAKSGQYGSVEANEYVVNIYDPNFTVLHERTMVLNPEVLRGRSLASFLTERSSEFDSDESYFGDGPRLGVVYPLQGQSSEAPDGPDPRIHRYVSEEYRSSRQMFYLTMLAGDHKGSTGYVTDRLTRRGQATGLQERTVLLDDLRGGASEDGPPALRVGLSAGHTRAPGAYIKMILEAEVNQLSNAEKVSLVEGRHPTTGVRALEAAFQVSEPSAVGAYSRAVLEAGGSLTMIERLALLKLPTPSGPSRGEPILHRVCRDGSFYGKEPILRSGRNHAVFVYLVAIAGAENLTFRQKLILFSSSHRSGYLSRTTTAAQEALKAGNPGAAAAMVCAAILANISSDQTGKLVDSLKIDVDALVKQLETTERSGDVELLNGQEWLPMIRSWLHQSKPLEDRKSMNRDQ